MKKKFIVFALLVVSVLTLSFVNINKVSAAAFDYSKENLLKYSNQTFILNSDYLSDINFVCSDMGSVYAFELCSIKIYSNLISYTQPNVNKGVYFRTNDTGLYYYPYSLYYSDHNGSFENWNLSVTMPKVILITFANFDESNLNNLGSISCNSYDEFFSQHYYLGTNLSDAQKEIEFYSFWFSSDSVKEDYYNNGYNKGYNDALEDGYNRGYDSGYDFGFDVGYYEGVNENFDVNFLGNAFIRIADVPFQVLSDFLNFDILGFNYFELLCSFLTLGVVLYLLRKFI